jgi:hypothetical protein
MHGYAAYWWENWSTWRTCHSAALSTPNPTWTGLGLNISLQNDRPVTSHSSHGTAPLQMRFILSWLLIGLSTDFTLHPSLTFHFNAWWQIVLFFTLRICLLIWWIYGWGKHRGQYTCTLAATNFHLTDRFCRMSAKARCGCTSSLLRMCETALL